MWKIEGGEEQVIMCKLCLDGYEDDQNRKVDKNLHCIFTVGKHTQNGHHEVN